MYDWTVEKKEREEQVVKVIFISVLPLSSTKMEPRYVSFSELWVICSPFMF